MGTRKGRAGELKGEPRGGGGREMEEDEEDEKEEEEEEDRGKGGSGRITCAREGREKEREGGGREKERVGTTAREQDGAENDRGRKSSSKGPPRAPEGSVRRHKPQ